MTEKKDNIIEFPKILKERIGTKWRVKEIEALQEKLKNQGDILEKEEQIISKENEILKKLTSLERKINSFRK